jgi:hypothetical protein
MLWIYQAGQSTYLTAPYKRVGQMFCGYTGLSYNKMEGIWWLNRGAVWSSGKRSWTPRNSKVVENTQIHIYSGCQRHSIQSTFSIVHSGIRIPGSSIILCTIHPQLLTDILSQHEFSPNLCSQSYVNSATTVLLYKKFLTQRNLSHAFPGTLWIVTCYMCHLNFLMII